jgi:hypothetical protein
VEKLVSKEVTQIYLSVKNGNFDEAVNRIAALEPLKSFEFRGFKKGTEVFGQKAMALIQLARGAKMDKNDAGNQISAEGRKLLLVIGTFATTLSG